MRKGLLATVTTLVAFFAVVPVAFAGTYDTDLTFQCLNGHTYFRIAGHQGETIRFGDAATGTPGTSAFDWLLASLAWDDANNASNGGLGLTYDTVCPAYMAFVADGNSYAYWKDYFRNATSSAPSQLYGVSFGAPNWGAITIAPPVNWQAYTAVATGTNLFSVSTSSLNYIAAQCDDNANIFSRGLCYAGTYLFIPNPEILNSYANLPTLMETKFPFSWVAAVKNAITALSATSDASPSYTIGLHDLGLGSTTPIGNIMPNVVALSTTTVRTYISSTVWNAMQTFFAAGLWVFLGFDIYATIRRRHAHV